MWCIVYHTEQQFQYMKRCSTPLIMREMQIKTTIVCHLTPIKMAGTKKIRSSRCWWRCGEKGTLVHYVWECKLVQPVWKTVWRFLKKSKIELPHDPTIPLLIFTQRKQKHWFGKICFTAAFFTIVKTWQQARCPSVDEWIKTKKLYTHTHTHTHIYIHTYIYNTYIFLLFSGFPGGSDGKESACNAGDLGSIPGSERSLEKGTATHSSILAWKIPWIEEPGGL